MGIMLILLVVANTIINVVILAAILSEFGGF